jgi:hypothetical protein
MKTPHIFSTSRLRWLLLLLLPPTMFLCSIPAALPAACDPSPAGLVSWWAFDNDATDLQHLNDGSTDGTPDFIPGKVGPAIRLDGTNDDVVVAPSQTMNVGIGPGMTIEGWFKPQDPFAQRPLVEWNKGNGDVGVHLWVSQSLNGDLFANVVDVNNTAHHIFTPSGLVTNSSWYHVALTYDRSSGLAVIYLNGVLVAQQAVGTIGVHTSYPLYFGRRIWAGGSIWFQGAMDEWGLYNRALSQSEVTAIVTADSAGRCKVPVAPSITQQPTNQNVFVGQPVAFRVEAIGSFPLTYQWYKGADVQTGATGPTLAIPTAALSDAGDYTVVVANAAGSVTSAVATLTVSAGSGCVPSPSGLVSWWPFDGNVTDLQSANDGVAHGSPLFGLGEVGSAIQLDGVDDDVTVPASPSLNVGVGAGMTIEGWFKPQDPFAQRPLVEWNNGSGDVGVHLWVSQSFNGDLFANVIDINKTAHHVFAPSGLVTNSSWYHVALTYNRASGLAVIYLNGVLVAQQAVGTIGVHTSYPLYFGRRPYAGGSIWFQGAMDEWGLYNRALSQSEVAAIVTADSAGRCKVPVAPSITQQPTNQTVIEGHPATFAVLATGAPPLTYQWYQAGELRPGATEATLLIPEAGFADAGAYQVVVANGAGSVTSVVATLTVSPRPGCVPVPSGVVAWWPFDGDGTDLASTNNATVNGSPLFLPGKVGSAILLDGIDDYAVAPPSQSLNVGVGGGMTIEGWFKPQNPLEQRPLAEWNDGNGAVGVHLWVSQSSNGDLFANVIDINGGAHHVFTPSGLVTSNTWYHIALTYDRATGVASIYLNGALARGQTIGSFGLHTSYALYFGRRPFPGGSVRFQGSMDEWALFDHALTGSQLRAIYEAGAAGKCKTGVAPEILTNPSSQLVILGGSASFQVGARGSAPLAYQWFFGTAAIDGATSSQLSLANVKFQDGGPYSVVVTNQAGSATSAVAILTVKPPPTLIRAGSVSGLVGNVVSLPLDVVAQGSENSISFTLSYPPALLSVASIALAPQLPDSTTLTLNTNSAESGRLGVTIALPEGVALAATTQALASVGFRLGAVTEEVAIPVSFEDQPVARQVLDTTSQPLLASFQPGLITASPTRIEVVSVDAASGGEFELPVRIAALGTENAVGFSLAFSTSNLRFVSAGLSPSFPAGPLLIQNLAQADLGKLGFALGLPAGAAFPAGTNELIRVRFYAMETLNSVTTPVTVADEPIRRQASRNDSSPLPVVSLNGLVRIGLGGLEGDVFDRPNGDQIVNLSDWTQLGRFAAGLDATTPQEFQRADCAPRDTKGNGRITVTDWVQAGRYAARLDPITSAGGPTGPVEGQALFFPATSERTLSLPSTNAVLGKKFTLPVRISAQGGETALGFSLRWDPAKLTFLTVVPGPGLSDQTNHLLQANANLAAGGQLGIALTLLPGASFTNRLPDLLLIEFFASGQQEGSTEITFTDEPAFREVASDDAQALPTAFLASTVTMAELRPQLRATRSGADVLLTWPSAASNFFLESAVGIQPTNWSRVNVIPVGSSDEQSVNLRMTNEVLLFRLHKP